MDYELRYPKDKNMHEHALLALAQLLLVSGWECSSIGRWNDQKIFWFISSKHKEDTMWFRKKNYNQFIVQIFFLVLS